ncbi:MAG: hypothetical protein QG573_1653, partial [Acidobacteriota bacterium]|nr:hypothetical protein [Acidobacteriota bacterium]
MAWFNHRTATTETATKAGIRTGDP